MAPCGHRQKLHGEQRVKLYAVRRDAPLAVQRVKEPDAGEDCTHEGAAPAPRRRELPHLDAVLRMFRPDFKTAGLPVRQQRPAKSPYFAHGELTRRIFDAIRERGTVTSFEIAGQAMRDKGLNPDNDPLTRTDFVRRVTLQLNDLCRKGRVEKIGRGRAMR